MIAQTVEIATPIAQVAQHAQPATLDPEQELEALAEDNLFHDEDIAELIELSESFFKARDKADFERALELKRSLMERIKLHALGMGITKEILENHYQRIIAA